MATRVSDPMLKTQPLELSGSTVTGDDEDKIVKTTSTGELPALDGSNLTNLTIPADISESRFACYPLGPKAAAADNDVVPIGTATVDEGSEFSVVDTSEHLQVTSGGNYRVDVTLSVSTTSTNNTMFTLQKDGGSGSWTDVGPIAGVTQFNLMEKASCHLSAILELAAGEKIRVLVKKFSGGGAANVSNQGSLTVQQIS